MEYRLFLNRPQLVIERRTEAMLKRFADCEAYAQWAFNELAAFGSDAAGIHLMRELFAWVTGACQLKGTLCGARPYASRDTVRTSGGPR
jgi:hypothetical protein